MSNNFSYRRYFLYGSAWSVTRNGIRIALSLLTVPVSIAYLGNEKYGLWMTVLSVMSFSSFLDIGITPMLLNRMAESFSKKDKDKFKRYFSGGLILGFCIFGFGIIFALISPLISWEKLFHVEHIIGRKEIRYLISLLMFISFGSLGFAVVENFFNARLKVIKPQIYATIANIIGFGLLLLSIKLRLSLPILAFFNMLPIFLYRILLLVEVLIRDRDLISLDFRVMGNVIRELIPTSIHFMGIQFAAVVISSAPNIIIAKTLGMNSVTTFSVSYKLYNMPLMFLAAIFPIFWPAFTIAWEKKRYHWLRKSIFKAIYLTAFLFTMYVVFIMFFGKFIIEILTLGNVLPSQKLMLFLGIWMVVQAMINWLSTFLHSITDFKFEFLSYLSTALMLTILVFILSKNGGLVGVSIAMGLTLFIGNLLPMWIRTKNKLRNNNKQLN